MTGSVRTTASVIFAAGRGSRMTGYTGNKTLLPLIPSVDVYTGSHPLLLEVLQNLPDGPKSIVVNHCADDVRSATQHLGVSFCRQPETNGTGGALIAARPFIESTPSDSVIITMGDVPLIRRETYGQLIRQVDSCSMALLAFSPRDRARYGMLEVDGDRVLRIVEWKYWKDYPAERKKALRFCNAGVYVVRRSALIQVLDRLQSNPHIVTKQRGEHWVEIKEYFLTDLVEFLSMAGTDVGMVLVDEDEVTGVDTPETLERVQSEYARRALRPK
jgi:bifunctional N-acetylglucosamine-1-phosphate-uridyltransferase/glucosamine-1-phosphate-acetyltransferase GlmU-like protein